MIMVCCILLGLILLGSLIGVTVHFCYFWFQWPDIAGFVEDSKCPACYGIDLCPEFYAGHITFDRDFKSTLTNYVNAKNVYGVNYGKVGGSAIVKKLAHDWELKSLDEKACQLFGSESDCNFDNLTRIDLWDDIIRMVEFYGRHGNADRTGLTLCPSTDGIFELLKPYEITNDSNSEKILLANVWTILSINPEPILLKYLNADSPKWPVPKYYGACGRATLQQDCGNSLSYYLSKPWLYRAELAINLLEMASVFTFNHTRFRFYLTDITSDNIVLKDWGQSKNIPIFVDLENVIVLDKKSTIYPEQTWSHNHKSEVIECAGCFAFSTEDICGHHVSDHNYYSICKLLRDEVLEGVPQFVLQRSPNFLQILTACVSPPGGQPDRFAAAAALDKELKNILKISDKADSNDL